jgi:hypothetical protein
VAPSRHGISSSNVRPTGLQLVGTPLAHKPEETLSTGQRLAM